MTTVRRVVAARRAERQILCDGFTKLFRSTLLANTGDGLALAAGPLLVESVSRSPVVIAAAGACRVAPPLVLGLLAGVASDTHDRPSLVSRLNYLRCVLLLVLVMAISTGHASVPVILSALLLLSAAETFIDNAYSAILPEVVTPADLGVATAKLQAAFITSNLLAGPAIGSLLFGLGAASPFIAQAILVAAGAHTIRSIIARKPASECEPPIRQRIRLGISYVRSTTEVRVLVQTITVMNVAYGIYLGNFVLFARATLGVSTAMYGSILTTGSFGGLLGTLLYRRIRLLFSEGSLMRIGLVIETAFYGLLASVQSWQQVFPLFAVFGFHLAVWATTYNTIRQRLVPLELQGRVGSVNLVFAQGAALIGTGIAGATGSLLGQRGVLWLAAALGASGTAVLWRQLSQLGSLAAEDPQPRQSSR